MGNPANYPPRFFLWQARADTLRPSTTTQSAAGTVGGTVYSATVGTPVLLPSGVELPSDRFVSTSGHYVGTTAQRPNSVTDGDVPNVPVGQIYLDSTLQKAIVHDGLVWRDVFSGAAV